MMQGPSEHFKGTDRFELRHRLGAGGMGVVYEAYDRERDKLVALKVLSRAGAADVYRFKREFRSLADVAHPNLVSLYELMSAGPFWFFTMELVAGVNFLDYVRHAPATPHPHAPEELPTLRATRPLPVQTAHAPDDARPRAADTRANEAQTAHAATSAHATCDLTRLRPALHQLAEGIYALHETEQLHRDIKPSNVLVTSAGRVVLLDFGLVTEASAPELRDPRGMAGTPAYMAPEQIAHQRVTQASDWYNVGVMLYEALTGRLPFAGHVMDVLERKQHHDPLPPRALMPRVPEDLDELCQDLLRRDPQTRPEGREILQRLALGASAGTSASAQSLRSTSFQTSFPSESDSSPDDPAELFVGREPQLAQLRTAYRAMRAGQSVVIYAHGTSGMGKTALIAHFLERLKRHNPHVVVLAGRCYERESMPYKALDGVVDSLSRHLSQLPRAEVDALVPRELNALARLFPVIQQVNGAGPDGSREPEPPDPLALRRRAFAALRELLTRLATSQQVVVFIDDLHWADADSTALLEDLLRPPDAPPLLLIVSFRSEEIAAKPFLKQLLQGADLAAGGELKLDPLPPDEAHLLVRSLLPPAERAAVPAEFVATIVREAAGNPLFIEELTRYALTNERAAADGSTAPAAGVTLSEMILTRLDRQPAGARDLLTTLAVAGRPVRPDVAAQATGLVGDEAPLIAALRAGHFLRSGGTTQQLELYHDRIRETLHAQLAPIAVQTIHRRLAETMTAKGLDDPEALFAHYLGAGEHELAATLATLAAQKATAALAFARAARLYRKALELAPPAGTHRAELHIKLGAALANAGRPAEAAVVYLAAADLVAPERTLELLRRAAEQFLMGGHINEGLDALRRVLTPLGFELAPGPKRALVSLLLRRAQLRLRGLKFVERPAAELPAAELLRIDTCWAVAAGLGLVDTMRSFDFQTRHLLLALRAGELYRVARALCVDVGFTATAGGPARQRTQQALATAEALAHRSGHPHARNLAIWARGIASYLVGDWPNAAKLCDRAAELLRDECTGVHWEVTTAHRFLLSSLLYLGELAELSRRVPHLLAAAKEQGNLLAATDLRTRLNLIWLVQDAPDAARQEVIDAMLVWPQAGFHLQHYSALLALAQIGLYTGDGPVAWKQVIGQWPALTRSMLMRVQILRIEAHHLLARCAIAAAVNHAPAAAARLLQRAEFAARQIERERMSWAQPLGALVRAGIAAQRADAGQAAELCSVAVAGFEAANMHLYAAAARRRLGQLTGGTSGQELVCAADAWLTAQRVRNPQLMTRMLAPGIRGGPQA